MPHTGEKCSIPGTYQGHCVKNPTHSLTPIQMHANATFPPCHYTGCSGAVNWTYKP